MCNAPAAHIDGHPTQSEFLVHPRHVPVQVLCTGNRIVLLMPSTQELQPWAGEIHENGCHRRAWRGRSIHDGAQLRCVDSVAVVFREPFGDPQQALRALAQLSGRHAVAGAIPQVSRPFAGQRARAMTTKSSLLMKEGLKHDRAPFTMEPGVKSRRIGRVRLRGRAAATYIRAQHFWNGRG